MPPIVVDLGVAILILAMTYALMSEGLWGAALMFFNALFAGLIAFNFYEPLAALLAENVEAVADYADMLCMLLIFAITLVILRLTTESIGPIMVRFPMPIYHLGRIFFALAGSCVTMAILLLGFHLAPIHKKMFYGAMDYDLQPPFGMGLDRKWLGFFQFTTGQAFAKYGYAPERSDEYPDYLREYRDSRVFDPRGRWLINHQNARPIGDDVVPEPLNAGPAAGAEGAVPAEEPRRHRGGRRPGVDYSLRSGWRFAPLARSLPTAETVVASWAARPRSKHAAWSGGAGFRRVG